MLRSLANDVGINAEVMGDDDVVVMVGASDDDVVAMMEALLESRLGVGKMEVSGEADEANDKRDEIGARDGEVEVGGGEAGDNISTSSSSRSS